MSSFKEMKFRVKSPADSRVLQQALFGLGYKWAYEDEAAVDCTDRECLYTDMRGHITHSDLEYFHSKNCEDIPEHTFNSLVGVCLVKCDINSELIEVNGLTYFKRDFNEAIAKLVPVNMGNS